MVVRCVLIHNSPSSLGCAKYRLAARDLRPVRLAVHFAVHISGRSRHRPTFKAEFSPAAESNHSQNLLVSGFSLSQISKNYPRFAACEKGIHIAKIS